MRELCHNVQPVPQPSPALNPGGDCFACSLAAILSHFSPGEPLSVPEASEFFQTATDDGKTLTSNTWPGFRQALCRASGRYGLEIHNDLVLPAYAPERDSPGFWMKFPVEEWCYRLEAWLSAGWVAAAVVDFEGRGPVRPDGTLNVHDHFIVLDGIRRYWKPVEALPGARSLAHDVHVVCSVKGAYWLLADDLLVKHGASALWLVRRDDRE